MMAAEVALARSLPRTTAVASVREERANELRQHLGHLDALRGLAILGVMWIHTGQIFPSSAFHILNDPGQRGVQLFYMVSAFTLLLSSQRRKQEPRPTLAFFLRRYFRLAPLCYVFILVAYIWYPPFHSYGFHVSLLGFFFIQGLLPHHYFAGAMAGWSLGVEALFYACFPFLNRTIRDLRSAVLWLFWGTVLTSAVWVPMTLLRPDEFTFWSYYSFVVNLPAFLLGFLCFFIWKRFLEPVENHAEAKWLSAAMLVVTGIVFLDVIPLHPYRTFISCIFCAGLLLAVAVYPWHFLVNRVTIFWGKISYSMYLFHVVLTLIVFPILARRFPVLQHHGHELLWCVAGFLAILAISSGVGALTWLFIEEPGIRLGRRVVRWVQGRAPQSTPLLVPAEAVLTTGNTPDAQF